MCWNDGRKSVGAGKANKSVSKVRGGVEKNKERRKLTVAPLRAAVRLVDGQEADGRAPLLEALVQLRQVHERRRELLRAEVDHQEIARKGAALDVRVALPGAQEARHVTPDRVADRQVDAAHLVLHQADERRHHHGDAVGGQGREDVAQRLALARRPHDAHVAAYQRRLDHLELAATKFAKAVVLPQHVRQGGLATQGGRGRGRRRGPLGHQPVHINFEESRIVDRRHREIVCIARERVAVAHRRVLLGGHAGLDTVHHGEKLLVGRCHRWVVGYQKVRGRGVRSFRKHLVRLDISSIISSPATSALQPRSSSLVGKYFFRQ